MLGILCEHVVTTGSILNTGIMRFHPYWRNQQTMQIYGDFGGGFALQNALFGLVI